jgi:sporulation protein YlmC with PRC-barrel domain
MTTPTLRAMVATAVTTSLIVLAASTYGADESKTTTKTTTTTDPNTGATRSSSTQTTTDRAAANTTAARDENEPQAFRPTLKRTNRLIGMKVTNNANEDLGRIEDIVIESGSNRISYAVLSFGGWLGAGDKYFAIPWRSLQITGDENNPRAVLNVDKQTLKNAPGFDKAHWPDMADRRWATDVDRYYGSDQRADWDRNRDDRAATSGGPVVERRLDTSDQRFENRNDQRFENRDQRFNDPDQRSQSLRGGDPNDNYANLRYQETHRPYDEYGRPADQRNWQQNRPYDARYGNPDDRGYSQQPQPQFDPRNDPRNDPRFDPHMNAQNSPDNRPANAEDNRSWFGRRAASPEEQRMNARRLSKVVGTNVKNFQGESLGNIEDVVIDTREGRVVYAVVSLGGVWGTSINEKLVIVPWTAVEMRPLLNVARVEADKQSLQTIAFDEHKWPSLNDRAYARRIYQHFDQQPYWEVYGYDRNERNNPAAAWMPGSEFLSNFDPNAMTTVTGVIDSVGTFTPDEIRRSSQRDHDRSGHTPDTVDGIRLRVKTTDGNRVTVYAGPQPFADKNNIQFYYGDNVKITGSKVNVDGRGVIMATEITKGNQTLKLLDNTGRPLWKESDLRHKSDDARFERRRDDQPTNQTEDQRGFFQRLKDRIRD